MRILMLISDYVQPNPQAPAVGGAARQCLKLSKALIQQGVEVTILTNRITWREPAANKVDGVPVAYLPTSHSFLERKGLRRLGSYAFILGSLAYLIRHRDAYDIFHAHSALTTGFVAVLAGQWLKKKSIIKVMNSGFRNDVLRLRNNTTIIGARQMANYLPRCDRVIALNLLARDELLTLGFRSEQIELIPNGVETDQIKVKTSCDSSKTIELIFVGRLVKAKGLEILLKALQMLQTQSDWASYRLTILGRGPLRSQLEAMTNELGIAGQVNFAGEVTNVPDYLFASDIFVLPSRAEGISNALLEAMAVGLPGIATDIAGNRAVIQNERNGLLVELENEVALAGAIDRLGRDNTLRQQLGQTARQTITSQFDMTTVVGCYINLYQKLLEFSN